jgi:hypothetical protein
MPSSWRTRLASTAVTEFSYLGSERSLCARALEILLGQARRSSPAMC